MDNIPSITVRVGATGGLLGVEVEDQAGPTELIETKAAEPMPSFGDEDNKPLLRPWLYA